MLGAGVLWFTEYVLTFNWTWNCTVEHDPGAPSYTHHYHIVDNMIELLYGLKDLNSKLLNKRP